jgi:hypothetical protein
MRFVKKVEVGMAKQADKHISFFELQDALAQPGCAVCRLAHKAVTLFMDGLIYESVTDPDAIDRLRATRGFCNTHAWQLADDLGANSVAILYHNLLLYHIELLEAGGAAPSGFSLRRLSGRNPATEAAVQRLAPQAPCLACRRRDESAERALGVFVDHIRDTDFAASYQASSGLCARHFREALQLVRDDTARRHLTEAQLHIWRSLKTEMDELIRKFDYRFAHEPMGTEADSWLRAVALLAGDKDYGDR